MAKRNGYIIGLLLVLLVVEIIILAPKEVGTAPETSLPHPSDSPIGGKYSQKMDSVYSVEAGAEGKQWELWADKGLQAKDSAEWTIEKVKVKFYAKNGVTYVVTGKTGRVIPNKQGIRDLRILGDVSTRSSNGHIFKSEILIYDSQNKKLHSSSAVQMVSPPDKDGGQLVLAGVEMIADLATNQISINHEVKATKQIRNKRTVKIQSDRAVFSGLTKMAEFFGQVLLSVDSMTLTGPEAKFTYDAGMESLESVLVGGGVRVTDRDKIATSKSVSVRFKDETVVFTGAPRVIQNGDEMAGDIITFVNGGKKVVVSNAKAQIDSANYEDAVRAQMPQAPTPVTVSPPAGVPTGLSNGASGGPSKKEHQE